MIKELIGDFFNEKRNIIFAILLFGSVIGYQSIESLGVSKILSKLYKSFETGNISDISKYTKYFIILYCIIIGLYILKDISYIGFQPKFYEYIINKLYNRIIVTYQKHFENLNVGELTSKYSSIPWNLKNLLYFFLINILPDFSALFIILVYIFTKNKFIFTTMIIGCIIIILITKHEYKNIMSVQNQWVNRLHAANGTFYEKINNLFGIYINNSVSLEIKKIAESEDNFMNIDKKGILTNNNLSAKIIIFNMVLYSILIGYIIKNNQINSSETSIFYLTLYGYFFRHSLTFGYETAFLLFQYSGIKSQAEFLNKLFRKQNLGSLKIDITDIKINDISFKYPKKDNYIIKNLNLTLENGNKVVIFGKSGSGKSTIFKLLMGFFSPINGKILINDKDINDLDLSYYRNQFAYVSQDTKLFDMSIIDNIKYSLNVTNEEVYNLISKYNINGIYEKLEKGLETPAGVDGNNLSGGQKQMVLILRAILKKPKIYLFDEPTAALDPNTRKIIYNILGDIKETTMVISHDLDIKSYFNTVYHLENSQLVNKK
tara:strand:+ start:171 stop:1808 length:1638 start_codon:yes stop_codon:yes gene_type:complete